MLQQLTANQLKGLRADLLAKTRAFQERWTGLPVHLREEALAGDSVAGRELLHAMHQQDERHQLMRKVEDELRRRGAL